MAYISNAHRAAQRDRDQLSAFYAAEAGIEQGVVFFNDWNLYLGAAPEGYTSDFYTHPDTIPLRHASVTADRYYDVFEPYIQEYMIGPDNGPLLINGEVQALRRTFFRNPAAGDSVAVSKTSKIPSFSVDLTDYPAMVFRAGGELARVSELTFTNPNDLEEGLLESLPAGMRVICRVDATGITPMGVRSRVVSFLSENPVYDVRSPGAVITKATATFNGQSNIYWGELWAGGDVELESNFWNKLPKYDPSKDFEPSGSGTFDRWFALRTEGVLKDSSGTRWADGRATQQGSDDSTRGFAGSPISPTAGNIYYQPYQYETLASSNRNRFQYYNNLYQHQDLEFPQYSYQDWKTFIVTNNFRYYYTGPNGTIYGRERDPGSADFGQIVGKSYADWFASNPSDDNYWDIHEIIAFIDTVPTNDAGEYLIVDGKPVLNATYYPRDPGQGGRMATISAAGQSLHTRGAMFVAGHINMTGQGNPPDWQSINTAFDGNEGGAVYMPNGDLPPSNHTIRVFHNGLMYSWGRVSNGGNRTFYGSVFAELGFNAGGSPKVYYNQKMADGSWLRLNVSVVNRNLWDISQPN